MNIEPKEDRVVLMSEAAAACPERRKLIKEVLVDRIILDDGALGYEIPRKGLSEQKKLVFWLDHLCQKSWFTCSDVRELLNFIKRGEAIECHSLQDAGKKLKEDLDPENGFVLTAHRPTATPFIKSVDEETVEIRRPNGSGYDIPREELAEPSQLLNWIEHLCEKNWVSGESIWELMQFVRRERKIKF